MRHANKGITIAILGLKEQHNPVDNCRDRYMILRGSVKQKRNNLLRGIALQRSNNQALNLKTSEAYY